MASKDIVSIILTTCCISDFRLDLLKTSMQNFRRMTDFYRKEFIVSDNGDGRQTEYIKTLKPNRHLVFGENRGITYGRNAGAEAATGDYLCFIDGDLIYRPHWLRTLKGLLAKYSQQKLIASGMLSGNMLKTRRYFIDLSLRWQIWSRTNGGCLLMSRQAWEDVGPWPNYWKLGSEFSNQAEKRGYSFIIPTPEMAMPLDRAPSYDKRLLMRCCRDDKPLEWRMIK